MKCGCFRDRESDREKVSPRIKSFSCGGQQGFYGEGKEGLGRKTAAGQGLVSKTVAAPDGDRPMAWGIPV